MNNEDVLRNARKEIVYIHIFTDDNDIQKLNKIEYIPNRDLEASFVQDLLEFIGAGICLRRIAIDGYEPLLDIDITSRLVAYSKLYDWVPIVNIYGETLKTGNYIAGAIDKISQIGSFQVKLNLSAKTLNNIGLEPICYLYSKIREKNLLVDMYYSFNGSRGSRVLIQKLLDCKDINNTTSSINMVPLVSYKNNHRKVLSKNKDRRCSELVIGHNATMVANNLTGKRLFCCNLMDQRWRNSFSEWLISSERFVNV